MKSNNEIIKAVIKDTGATIYQIIRTAELIDKFGEKSLYRMSKKQKKIAFSLIKIMKESNQ